MVYGGCVRRLQDTSFRSTHGRRAAQSLASVASGSIALLAEKVWRSDAVHGFSSFVSALPASSKMLVCSSRTLPAENGGFVAPQAFGVDEYRYHIGSAGPCERSWTFRTVRNSLCATMFLQEN